jgi:glycosyltransferase involved in cell wall biosynthesis
MAAPWLSVLVPVHNGARYLEVALQSVLAQTPSLLDGIELVVVDDGSTDGTSQIFDAYRSRLNLKIVRNKRNAGWTAATNLAMSLATGTYQCWLHHDDVWLPDRLSRLRDCQSRYPHAVLILQPSWFINQAGLRVGLWRCPLPANRLLPPDFVLPRLLVQNFTATPAPMYRSDMAFTLAPLDDRLWYNADWDFWLRLAETGQTVYCPEPLSCYRIHPESLTARRTADSPALWRQFNLILDRYFDSSSQHLRFSGVADVARFSALANIELAHWAAGGRLHRWRLCKAFLQLGPRGWRTYLRDSRIRERAVSRLRIRLNSRPTAGCALSSPAPQSIHTSEVAST